MSDLETPLCRTIVQATPTEIFCRRLGWSNEGLALHTFSKLIVQGQARGEISQAVIPDTASRTLLNLLIGLRVLSRNRPKKALLNSFKAQVEAILPPGDHATLPAPVSVKHDVGKVHANVAYAG